MWMIKSLWLPEKQPVRPRECLFQLALPEDVLVPNLEHGMAGEGVMGLGTVPKTVQVLTKLIGVEIKGALVT